MKKNIKIADGKTAEIIIDIAKDRNVFIEVGKLCNVTILEIIRGATNQGPTLDPTGSESGLQLKVNLIGKKSVINIHSLVVGLGGNKSKNEIEINHLARETNSAFTGYALLKNNAEHTWEISTVIENVAKKSVASQKINNLLLGENGVVKNRPALIIRNNDVSCSHAVATGHLDEEQLFYAQARGLTVEQSKSLMARGFVEPFIRLLPKNIQQEIIGKFDQGPTLDNLVQGRSLVGRRVTNSN
ncbi:MAG: SufD family Fe-S cluster assembly protein [bacterium]|nr:SufD family Fe-S cluster assembly protein [bacterium]